VLGCWQQDARAELTGCWEVYLKGIERGVGSPERFMRSVETFVQWVGTAPKHPASRSLPLQPVRSVNDRTSPKTASFKSVGDEH